jgi:rhodanese-related sulfurtransferase
MPTPVIATEVVGICSGKDVYCGLYVTYAILKSYDTEVEFSDLVNGRYVGSSRGSSMAELKSLVEDYNLYATAVTRLAVGDLFKISPPIILHVKSSMESRKYDHYILFLGIQEGMARIFTPPDSLAHMPLRKLSYIWDGNALVVSKNPINISRLFIRNRLLLLSAIVAAAVGVIVIHLIRKRYFAQRFSIPINMWYSAVQAFCILTIAFILCFGVHFFPDAGFLSYGDAVDSVQKAHAAAFIPKISRNKAAKIMGNGAIIVDARVKEDYDAGHIDNAISLPINCSDEEYTQTTSSFPKNRSIVLYCQSETCKYAEIMAIRLREDGFNRLAVFRGGWVEWQRRNEL